MCVCVCVCILGKMYSLVSKLLGKMYSLVSKRGPVGRRLHPTFREKQTPVLYWWIRQ